LLAPPLLLLLANLLLRNCKRLLPSEKYGEPPKDWYVS
jgi:hypothetical protein